jgi:hypothetical protein
MAESLAALSEGLRSVKLRAGTACVLALESGKTELLLVADSLAQEFFDLPSRKTPFLELEEGTDPRPLYFLPYDPDCDQSEEEREYGKRVLFERIHVIYPRGLRSGHATHEPRF